MIQQAQAPSCGLPHLALIAAALDPTLTVAPRPLTPGASTHTRNPSLEAVTVPAWPTAPNPSPRNRAQVKVLEVERGRAVEAAARARAEAEELSESKKRLQWQSRLLEKMSEVRHRCSVLQRGEEGLKNAL
jgi:hypothetical protein